MKKLQLAGADKSGSW